MLRDADCGAFRKEHIGGQPVLAGWVNRRRSHGGVIFIDLRDRSGMVQVVFNPEQSPQAYQVADQLRPEWVVQVRGTVRERPPGTENPGLDTGAVEIAAEEAVVLNASLTPPFYLTDDVEVDESLRLRYRYLDLRRPKMLRNLVLRHRVVKFIRDFLDARGFLEIETPILIKSTPEGARDFMVPSRMQPGSFYALPQSPQQLKQLLMVAGVERYYQIARCFRDEDLRADRQLDALGDVVEVERQGRLGDRLEQGVVVDQHLQAAAELVGIERAGDRDHRRAVEEGITDAGREIGGAGAEGGEAEAGLAGLPAHDVGGEGGRAFVRGQHEFDPAGAHGLDQRQHVAARDAETVADAGGFQDGDDQFSVVHGASVPSEIFGLAFPGSADGSSRAAARPLCYPLSRRLANDWRRGREEKHERKQDRRRLRRQRRAAPPKLA